MHKLHIFHIKYHEKYYDTKCYRYILQVTAVGSQIIVKADKVF